jgi:hypothetical protein
VEEWIRLTDHLRCGWFLLKDGSVKGRTAKSCQDYRDSVPERCEVTGNTYKLETHHILGRSKAEESDWFCNLILISQDIHNECHDKNPAHWEVRFLWEKWKRSQRMLEIDVIHDESRKIWNPAAMDKLCFGGGLVGRLSGIIEPKLKDADVKNQCEELIKALGE